MVTGTEVAVGIMVGPVVTVGVAEIATVGERVGGTVTVGGMGVLVARDVGVASGLDDAQAASAGRQIARSSREAARSRQF